MIRSLLVRNVVIVEQAGLMLSPGLTVITGETGAGKSVLMGSLELIQGRRASTDLIRPGADEAIVTAELQTDTGLLEIRRCLYRDGRHRVHIDGEMVTLAELRARVEPLIEIHSQQETRLLADPEQHRIMLDRWLQNPEQALAVRTAWGLLREAANALRVHRERARSRAERMQWLDFQISRLAPIALQPGEWDALQEKAERLRYANQIRAAIDGSLALLNEDEPAAVSLLASVSSLLAPLAGRVSACTPLVELIVQAETAVDQLIRDLQSLSHSDDDEENVEAQLEELEERLTAVQQYERDNQVAPDNQWNFLQQLQTERLALVDFEGEEKRLLAAESAALQTYTAAAEQLHAERVQAERLLLQALQPFLDRLALAEARLQFQFTAAAASADGADEIQLLFASSSDLPLRPVHKVASGGELSRLLLAVKGAESERQPPRTLVFDEIDSGVGGETAHAIADTLRIIARRHQVIAITHLPQVAGAADRHFSVQKDKIEGRTVAVLNSLEGTSRERELARMLGWESSPQSQELARAMLNKG